ncbi:hypothetical protein B0H14DRAFT_3170763 [Mycena olivaceomarginata]|nr:hypothetical protein B0H14DRAFT_3170763 [Mycena olivaceomarginata]
MTDVKKSISKPSRMGPCATLTPRQGFSKLRLEVSTIRKASLRSSLSHYGMLCDFLKGHTFHTVLRCLDKVRKLETHIEAYIEGISSRDFLPEYMLSSGIRFGLGGSAGIFVA